MDTLAALPARLAARKPPLPPQSRTDRTTDNGMEPLIAPALTVCLAFAGTVTAKLSRPQPAPTLSAQASDPMTSGQVQGPGIGVRKRAQPPRLRIQSAVFMKLSASRVHSAWGTAHSPMAWSMQATHWSRSWMPMENGMWRMRRRGWPKRCW